ncbi:hypothetical protein [Mesorhizobium onobrychidis]|uniref:Uncharacterized protein n=1 Tax=Mesorhizobium onobrychidis TaxID=2775404 RepID=A0ABY5R072_9HYPH|nr:hypothetical protein [Mesorhizobium onobrychidis]UVC16876.1 hypothetical protein IHQ72_06920 [Mesorhizobium onobrychidis]
MTAESGRTEGREGTPALVFIAAFFLVPANFCCIAAHQKPLHTILNLDACQIFLKHAEMLTGIGQRSGRRNA